MQDHEVISGRPSRREPVSPEELLEAAMNEFVVHGFSKANIGRVIATVGGSRRNIYKHFSDKAGLFEAVVRMLGARTAEAVVHADAAENLPPREYLSLVAKTYLSSALAYEGLCLYRLAVAEGEGFPTVSATLRSLSGHEEIARKVADYLRPRLANGRERDRARALAEMFLSLARGELYLQATLQPRSKISQAAIDEQAEEAVRLFLDGAAVATLD